MSIEILSIKLEKELNATVKFTNQEGQKVTATFPNTVHEDMFRLLKELSEHVIRYFKLMGAAVDEKESAWSGRDRAFHAILMGKVKPYHVVFGGREDAEAVSIVARHYQDDKRTTTLKTPNIIFTADGYSNAAQLGELCYRIQQEAEAYTRGKNSVGLSMDFGSEWGYAKPEQKSHRVASSKVVELTGNPSAVVLPKGQPEGEDGEPDAEPPLPEAEVPEVAPNPLRERLEKETADELKVICKMWGIPYAGKSPANMVDALIAANYVYP